MHTIDTDTASGIIAITISGFCTDRELADFMRDLDDAVAHVTAKGRRHSILCDYTHAAIQSQATIAALQARVLAAEPKARRVALFTRGQLARMQAKRIAAVRAAIGVFGDRESALAWLTDAEAPEVPAASAAAG